jgi:hypothetical protein
MAVNLTLFPTEAPAVVWFENGDSQAYDPQQENSLQIPSGSVCTISSTAGSAEDDEHPPKPPEEALAFAERMIATWQRLRRKAQEEISQAQNPTATPL